MRDFDVVFLNNNSEIGSVITGEGQTTFIQWINEGGGVVGNHLVMMHDDAWRWFTDSMAFTKFESWASPQNAQVQVDTAHTSGVVRAQKPEYAPLLDMLPKTPWTWSERWMSFISNPREQVDMLMTVDEKTFVAAPPMAGDHPVTWTYKLPKIPGAAKQGRFFYSQRGFDADGLAFADSNTQNMFHFGICWAAAHGFTPTSCQMSPESIHPNKVGTASFDARVHAGVLWVKVTSSGKHVVELFSLSGRMIAHEVGAGDKEYSFAHLKNSRVYIIKVKAGDQTSSRRVVF